MSDPFFVCDTVDIENFSDHQKTYLLPQISKLKDCFFLLTPMCFRVANVCKFITTKYLYTCTYLVSHLAV